MLLKPELVVKEAVEEVTAHRLMEQQTQEEPYLVKASSQLSWLQYKKKEEGSNPTHEESAG